MEFTLHPEQRSLPHRLRHQLHQPHQHDARLLLAEAGLEDPVQPDSCRLDQPRRVMRGLEKLTSTAGWYCGSSGMKRFVEGKTWVPPAAWPSCRRFTAARAAWVDTDSSRSDLVVIHGGQTDRGADLHAGAGTLKIRGKKTSSGGAHVPRQTQP